MFLKQSTASQEILLGPFVDDTDGKTAETALSIANTDIKIWKSGGTTESSKNSGGATHIASGRYYTVLDATDTDTVGLLEVNVHVAGALPVRRQYYVLEEAVYDQFYAASATGLNGAVGSVTGAVGSVTGNVGGNVVGSVASVTGAVGSVTGNVGGNVVGSVASVTGAVGSVTGNVGGNVVGSVASVTARVTANTDQLAGQTVTAAAGVTFPTSVASPTNITAASGITLADGAITDAKIGADAITAAKVAADVSTEIASAVWSAGTRTLTSFGTLVSDIWSAATRTLTAISDSSGVTTLLTRIVGTLASGTHNPQTGDAYSRLGAPAGASIAADIATKLPTASYTAPPAASEIADAVWDEAISGHATAGSTGAALSAAQSAGDPWSTTIPGAYASGTAGYKLGNLSSGSSSGAAAGEPITRNLNETEPLLFTHAVASAVFTGGSSYKRQYAGATTTPTTLVATPAFLHTVNGQHWYQIPYNASDWPTEAGPIRYELRDTSGNVADFAVYFTDGSTGGGGGADITVEDRSITVE